MAEKMKTERILETFLWICAAGFAAFAPANGIVNDYIPKISVFSLGFAALFAAGMLCRAFVQKRVFEYVRNNKVLLVLLILVCGISGVKYAGDLVAGVATTFFAYFAIPVYMVGAFFVSLWLKEEWGRHHVLMQLYALAFGLSFLLFNDRYIMDVGGFIRAVGSYSNPNEMSIYAFCALAFSACLIWEKQYSVIVNLALASISMCALILGQSRTALGGVAIAVVTAVASYLVCIARMRGNAKTVKRSWLRGSILAAVFILLTAMFCRILPPSLLEVTDIRGEYYTYTGRVELIKAYPELREQLEVVLRQMNPPSREEDYFKDPNYTGPYETEGPTEIPGETTGLPSSTEPAGNHRPDDSEPSTQTSFIKRFLSRFVSGNGTNSSGIVSNLRFQIWIKYLMNLDRYWLFGAENGFASVKPVISGTARECHNTPLYLFVQYGLIVVLLFAAVAVKLFIDLLLRRPVSFRKVPYGGILLGLLPFVLLQDLVNVAAFWFILAVVGAAAGEANGANPKNIAVVRRYSGMGGIENQILNICEGLREKGTVVHLITDQQSQMSEKAAEIGACIHICSLNNPFIDGVRVARYCQKHHVEVLQSHMFYESILCRVARFLCGSACHVFRVHTYIDCSHISQQKKRLYHLLALLTDSKVDVYLPINDYNCREMRTRSHIPGGKIQIVHDGVPEIGEPYAYMPQENHKIAMVANLVRFKGHDTLVDGLEILRSRGILFQAYLYGDCPVDGSGKPDTMVRDELAAQIRQKGLEEQVLFCGYTTDIRNSLGDVWALVLPSDSEGTPNCVLEAMSLKVLTVCSNVGGVPEFIQDGITGYCHEPKNPQAFADAMERAWNASAETNREIVNAAYHIWKEEYSVPSMIDGLIESYRLL